MPSAIELSVYVFGYNEVDTSEAMVRELDVVLRRLGTTYEIVMLDDGSTDGTGAIFDKLAPEIPHSRVIHHPENRGLGGAYRTAFDDAKGEFMTFFAADGQFPGEIVELFHPYLANHDVVLGYLNQRRNTYRGRALSYAERVVYRALFGKLPKYQGISLFRTSVVRSLPLKSTGRGWGILMETVVRCVHGGYRIVSVPTSIRPRTHGVSKANDARAVRENLKQVLRLRRLL